MTPAMVLSEEQYLAINNAGRQNIGDASLHKNKGRNSDAKWRKIVERQAKKDHDLIIRRSVLRKEYYAKVESGEIRPPSMLEERIATANGHPDNAATQAARRLLEKRGIDWRTE